jgi:hypothetical protein
MQIFSDVEEDGKDPYGDDDDDDDKRNKNRKEYGDENSLLRFK